MECTILKLWRMIFLEQIILLELSHGEPEVENQMFHLIYLKTLIGFWYIQMSEMKKRLLVELLNVSTMKQKIFQADRGD